MPLLGKVLETTRLVLSRIISSEIRAGSQFESAGQLRERGTLGKGDRDHVRASDPHDQAHT